MAVKCLISKENTLIIKGCGILLMLIHHLFYDLDSRVMYDDFIVNIHGHEFGLANQFGVFGKLCVALFVFLSGYGLTISTPREHFSLKQFYFKRFTKLYMNYWFIILLFVPIGVLFFDRSLGDAYGSHVILKAVLDFWGVLSVFGMLGYNPTWWFYSCIIILYLLHPLLNKGLSHHYLSLFTISVIISLGVNVPFISPIAWYLLPFIVGMITACIPLEYLSRIKPIEAFLCFIILSGIRNFSGNIMFIIDTMLCVLLAIMVYHWAHQGFIRKIFIQLGKHSMNMFLFHTFIFHYWFMDETYYFRNPVIITLQLLIICYILSVVIEFIKNKIGFYGVINRVYSSLD